MLRRRFFFVAPLALGLLLASSKEAKADPFASDPVEEAAPKKAPAAAAAAATATSAKPSGPRDSWYGYQTLTIDLPAATLTAIGAFSQHSAGAVVAVGGLSAYVLGGPIVHWAHGHVGRGLGSLAMRIGIPAATAVTGMVIGFAAHKDRKVEPQANDGFAHLGDWVDEMQAGIYGFIIGGVIGTAGASVIDSLALAREHSSPSDKPKDDNAQSARPIASSTNKVTWQPTFNPATRGSGFQAGVTGTF